MLNKFSEMIRGNLTKLQRLKIVALVTIEVHGRDVIEKLIKSGCSDVSAFEWLSQLRLYWDKVWMHACHVTKIYDVIRYHVRRWFDIFACLFILILTDYCCIFKDIDDCVVRQTNTQFQYGYEYLGNSGRLVITPLTDRLVCFVLLGCVE